MNAVHLQSQGIYVKDIVRNPSVAQLYEAGVRRDGAVISSRGALIAYSGEKTGRSPSDKRVVCTSESEQDVWWGKVNIPIAEHVFEINRQRAVDFLNTSRQLYCIDGFAGWDPKYRIKVRVICARPYHALFMHNMLIRPSTSELESFGDPDCVIFNAGTFPANQQTEGMTSKTSVALSLEKSEIVILGTEYAGEMKKGVFTLMNYLMPKQNVLSMHCSATAHPSNNSSTLLFGLSGTGKTTLSADPNRLLIGDDEHCWSDDGVFNIEGGCYAKAIDLNATAEPQIFNALRFGSVLENVAYDDKSHMVDYSNTSFTENTRGAYPIEFIENAKIPCIGGHPNDVVFLTCDAFGVLPPVSRLSPEQAEYHFVSGYTAKVAGTEMGIDEPVATFSPCFGGPFLVMHPARYAELLSKKMAQHGTNAWLVNTGWTRGQYGSGSRISLAHTRAILDAIHAGDLNKARTEKDPHFGFEAIAECPQVPDDLLIPRKAWSDTNAYNATAQKLCGLFVENFDQYKVGVRDEVIHAGPMLATSHSK